MDYHFRNFKTKPNTIINLVDSQGEQVNPFKLDIQVSDPNRLNNIHPKHSRFDLSDIHP